MPTALDATKALFVIGATGAIIAIGWRENWFAQRGGVVATGLAFYIMASVAFPPPTSGEWRIALSMLAIAIGAVFAFWTPPSMVAEIEKLRARTAARKQNGETNEPPEPKVVWVADVHADRPADHPTGGMRTQ